jgi:glycerate-2-kinase
MYNKDLINIYNKAVEAVLPQTIVKENLAKYQDKKVYLFSVGKAGFDMAKEAEKVLGKNIVGGLAISNKTGKLKHLKHFTSTHPIVSQKSVKAGNLLVKRVRKLKEEDNFIFFLSGGASSMIEVPKDNMSLKQLQKTTTKLLHSGIDIKELNKQRKKLSQIKGGKLADNFKTQNGEVFVLSDVVGDDIDTIGSAPMNNGKFKHTIIGNNKKALKAAKKYISKKVEHTKIITATLNMSTQEASTYIGNTIEEYDKKYKSFCLLFGGETTTKVEGKGIGGRNQELALRVLAQNDIPENISILCVGSDGIDGNS